MITGGFFSVTGKRVSVRRDDANEFVVTCGALGYEHAAVDDAVEQVRDLCDLERTDPRLRALWMALSLSRDFLK